MPSARELLEQADALMRRNRGRETIAPAMGPRTMAPTLARKPPPGDFPVLTERMESTAAPGAAGEPERGQPPAVPPQAAAPFAQAATPAAQVVAPVPQAPAELPRPLAASAAAVAAAASALRATSGAPPMSGEAAKLREPPRIVGDVALPPAGHDAPRAPPPDPDFPVLTDAIAEIDAALLAVAAEGEPSIWNDEAMRGDDSVLGPAPKSVAVIPDSHMIDAAALRNAATREAWMEEESREVQSELAAARGESSSFAPERVAAPQPAAVEPPVDTAAQRAAATDELIEELRMQVLQRIDMFTDTGLREQLGERLKPIVDRASAELVQTINQHVGELLRGFVAEAIERELDRLRKDVDQG